MAIQMRRGLQADFDPTKMLPGEWAVAIDSDTSKQVVWMCFAPGVVKRIGTYEDFVERYLPQMKEYYDKTEEYAAVASKSSTSAKASETSAKNSETLAQEYMEKAFSGTPEGYEQLVEDVRLMDIKQTTETTLRNSKAGGYKLVSMSGKSVQNGTQTVDSPIAIQNTFGCVEMIQGAYWYADGVYQSNANFICNKTSIPCKEGDTIKISLEKSSSVFALFYNESGFVTYGQRTAVIETIIPVPSGATKFNFDIGYTGITSDTVGKITLTINGKYVVQIVNENKNLWSFGDVSGSGGIGKNYKSLPIGTYTMSLVTDVGVNVQIYDEDEALIVNQGVSHTEINKRTSVTFTLTKQAESLRFYSSGQANITNIQLERGEVMTDYEEHKETVATVLLNETLRESDVLSRTQVVRNRARAVFDSKNFQSVSYTYDNVVYFKLPTPTDMQGRGQYVYVETLCNRFTTKSIASLGNNFSNTANIGNMLVEVDNVNLWFGFAIGTTLEEAQSIGEIVVEYPLATPTIETLDNDSQLALNSLETFDGVTHINVDSRTQPSEIVSEYGTSKVGAYTLKLLLDSESNTIRYNELAVALLSVGSEV